ncbi:MAG: serine/threonine protein kinase [Deltaproteobacteria bacterium]|nr:serine/threonine protein kinase [Deltaproteobacteria bacterium]
MSGKVKKDTEDKQSPKVTPQSSIRENADTEISTIRPDRPPVSPYSEGWIGRIIDDRYEIVELLGEGGMGAVFVARHLKLDKEVAFKVILPIYAGDGEIAARFAREAMATAKFEHPHVASAIDYGMLPEGGAFFVMQLVRGDNLNTLLEKEGRLHWSRAAEIGAQLADALSAAAAYGIVHRDLKPENIIIQKRDDRTDLVKVLDFGIARHTRDSIPVPSLSGERVKRKLTRDGAVVGTPGYMAPEQAIGDRAGHPADLYALGVVIWECIAGRQLWDSDNLSTLIQNQLTKPVPSLRDLLPEEDIPEELDRLILQLMAVRPQDRPVHAGEVRDVLRGYSLSVTATAFPIPEIRTGSQATTGFGKSGSKPNAEQSPPEKPRRRSWALVGSGAVIILVLVAFFGLPLFGVDPIGELQALLVAGEGAKATLVDTATEIVEKQRANPRFQKLLNDLNLPIPDVREHGVQSESESVGKENPSEDQRGEAGGSEITPADQATVDMKVPRALNRYIKPVTEGGSRKERVDAAEKILAYRPADKVPAYLLAVAELQKATLCSEKKEVLIKIAAIKDKRALPALRKLARQRRTGCGPRRKNDCLGCLRDELSAAIQQFKKKSPSDVSR